LNLAGEDTRAVARLAALARLEPRLTAPLLLWAVKKGHDARLRGALGEQSDLARELARGLGRA